MFQDQQKRKSVITIAKARLNEVQLLLMWMRYRRVDCRLHCRWVKGKVYAFDEDEAAVMLTKSNVQKFGVENTVALSRVKRPVLISLPNADAIFIGGGVSLRTIIQTAHYKLKANGRIVINAILLETATTAIAELKAAATKTST